MKNSDYPSVLIVEDDSISIVVLKRMLADKFDIYTATNSKEAFENLNNEDFSIILMDINLGEDSMDGTSIMKHIKQSGKYGDPSIVAVTSYAMPEDRQTFLEEGFDDYLAKPVKKAELLNAIEEKLV